MVRTRNRRSSRRRRGFTLMEVLLVLAILVILASMTTFYFRNVQQESLAKAARIEIGNLEQCLDLYLNDMHAYPKSLDALRTRPADAQNANKWKGPYLKKDLKPDPWGNNYQYELNADGPRIISIGPDQQKNTDDDISNI